MPGLLASIAARPSSVQAFIDWAHHDRVEVNTEQPRKNYASYTLFIADQVMSPEEMFGRR